MPTAQLAQADVLRPRAPWGDPVMRAFVLALDAVDQLAETGPGSVRRLRPGEGHGAVVVADDRSPVLVDLSVWESYAPLHEFVHRSAHGGFLRHRTRWSRTAPQPAAVLWWAFGMRRRFEPDGRPSPRRPTA